MGGKSLAALILTLIVDGIGFCFLVYRMYSIDISRNHRCRLSVECSLVTVYYYYCYG
jgi:hypothetical protein